MDSYLSTAFSVRKAQSIADAMGTVGPGGYVLTTTASLAQVAPIASATIGEITVTAYQSVSEASSSSVTGSVIGP